jgi:hypothetical protein
LIEYSGIEVKQGAEVVMVDELPFVAFCKPLFYFAPPPFCGANAAVGVKFEGFADFVL